MLCYTNKSVILLTISYRLLAVHCLVLLKSIPSFDYCYRAHRYETEWKLAAVRRVNDGSLWTEHSGRYRQTDRRSSTCAASRFKL